MRENGQSLIEVLGAITILTVAILGLIAVNTRSVYNASFAREQSSATQYAQEIIEKIRVRRNQNTWLNFVSNCEGTGALGAYPTPPLPFSLSVDCYLPTDPSADCQSSNNTCEVMVVISWQDVSGTHRSRLTTRLNNWQ